MTRLGLTREDEVVYIVVNIVLTTGEIQAQALNVQKARGSSASPFGTRSASNVLALRVATHVSGAGKALDVAMEVPIAR
ncbi:unnamed protein product [Phytophthora fragariaefolia]|uniref:Unnamed protein product n=1 Tax=Phytophthora fragariaefolia TaxID=1490495 RepID=A0A9W7CLX1_9STRA|nr:unnamed protein product [Phytophthora fragariaefolia]